MIAAKIVIVNAKDQLVGKICEGKDVDAVNAKIAKYEEKGVLVRVDAWLDEE